MKYNQVDSITRWASRNLPVEELIAPTIKYVTNVCAGNTWTKGDALSHIEKVIAQNKHFLPETLPALVSTDPDSRSMAIMSSLTERVMPWTKVPKESTLLRSHIVVMEDCIHTGNSVIKALAKWREVVRPSPNFQVHLITLSAHSEGLSAVRRWTEVQGGTLLDYGIGKLIDLFSVRDGARFPWTIVPNSDFARAASEYSEIVTYLRDIQRLGQPTERLTEAQAQDAQPMYSDLPGAVGLLLIGVNAYRRGLEKGTKTGGIRPMGYVDEGDPLKRHHTLGFGSPFTWWMGVPNTSPLGIWASPPIYIESPSLFVRRKQDEQIITPMKSYVLPETELDDLPF